jgi:EmrB/QacA subfamily drug resistance transporter
VTSLACALAPSIGVLIAARALQGVFGALLVPSTLAIIIATFPENERGGAIGSWTAWSGVTTVVGPLVGGALIDSASWRWVFLINVPLVAVALVLTVKAIPHTASQQPDAKVDFLGGLLCAAGLGGVIYALIEQPRLGWGDPGVAIAGAVGVVALIAFVLHERRTASPMLPLHLFRSRNFAVGNLATLTMYAGLGGTLFFVGLYLQQVAGYSALAAGASYLPLTFVTFFLARRFGKLADEHGPRLFMGVGPILAGTGLALLMRLDAKADYVTQLLPGLLVFAFGLAMTVAPLTAAVLAAVDEKHAGVASGVNNAVARVAGVFAIAVLGAFVSSQFASSLDGHLAGRPLSAAASAAVTEAKDRSLTTQPAARLPAGPERAEVHAALAGASTSAFRLGIGIGAGLVLIGGVVSLVGIENPRRRVACEDCAGGALVGASEDVGKLPQLELPRPAPARA